MSVDSDTTTAPGLPPLRDEDGQVTRAYMSAVEEAVEARDAARLKELVDGLHEADVGDLLGLLDADERLTFIELLGRDFDYTVLTEVDEAVRDELLRELPPTEVAEGLAGLDSDDAVYLIEDLEEDRKEAILSRLPFAMRHRLKRSLDYPEDSAGRLMQSDFVAMPPFWTVGQVIDSLREETDLPETFYQIFVVDPAFRLLGTVALDRLLRTPRPVRVSDIMEPHPHTVRADEDQEEAARLFQRYNLISVAVVDDSDRLVGKLTIDDIVDVIEEEAEEDIRRLAGAGDAELSDTTIYVARTRIPWLLVNMVTAFIASFVIAVFDGTIEAMVALAILMPVVAALGGNAGLQAMTVTVRAIAQKAITRRNVVRVVSREVLVALMNGATIAVLVGTVAAIWFSDIALGGVIASAIVFNIFCAGFFGVTLPMLLDRLGIDPAVASSVFLTTLTDVIGFFVFLGLARWWFDLV